MPKMSSTERDARKVKRAQERAPRPDPDDVDTTKTSRDRTKESDRITITIDENGKANLGKMRGPTLDKLRTALDGIDVFGSRAASDDPPPPPTPDPDPADELWGDDQIREVVRVAGMVQVGIAMRVWGVDLKTAREIVMYDDAELDRLTPPATKVTNKYSPAWAKKYRDEISLVLVFGSILQSKINRLNDHVTKTVVAAPVVARPRPTAAPVPPVPAAGTAQPSTDEGRLHDERERSG